MNGHELPGIPGLLDQQLGMLDIPALPDLQIAPLRNPDPARHNNAPVLLEPLTKPLDDRRQARIVKEQSTGKGNRSISCITPGDVLSAREAKNPYLAISELVDTNGDGSSMLQLPSFVSLSVVEKSPVPRSSQINPHKRLRLDIDSDAGAPEMNRVLPRPSKKDEKVTRPVPLLPAMVTGLHEPPPSAGLLPSMSAARPEVSKTVSTSKMDVKEILTGSKDELNRRPAETTFTAPDDESILQPGNAKETLSSSVDAGFHHENDTESNSITKTNKSRRQYRKWLKQETTDLLDGVNKYGIGKWKQILKDDTFSFGERSAVDLKDRYRVLLKDQGDNAILQSSPTDELSKTSQLRAIEPTVTEDTSSAPRHRKKRQRWTLEEDATLLAGVNKHGFQWSAIHADPEMQWGNRRPTDLRDRIRTLFPEGYKRADTRPLAKERDKIQKALSERNVPSDSMDASTRSKPKARDVASEQQLFQKHTKVGSDDASQLGVKSSTGGKTKETREPHQFEHAGVTLPSLALDDDDMEWDNRLPPLLDWEDI